MKYPSLRNLIDKLKSSPRVKGIFTTGTTATKMNPSSDIDFVVVLDKNPENIKSVYTMIENRFTDVFFFDIAWLNELQDKSEVSGDNFDSLFLEWLVKGKIEHDPENILSALRQRISENPPLQKITDSEKRDFWIRTNYNFIANWRYYNSQDEVYRKALELRLLHSVSELMTAYFSFRDMPWRGEKTAVKYLEQNDKEFLSTFEKYSKSASLDEKFKHYGELFNAIFFSDYQKWEDDFIVPIAKQNQYSQELVSFWGKLTDNENQNRFN